MHRFYSRNNGNKLVSCRVRYRLTVFLLFRMKKGVILPLPSEKTVAGNYTHFWYIHYLRILFFQLYYGAIY